MAQPHDRRGERRARQLLLAACLSGALLLALEVVWFRFLLLVVTGTSLAFAVMLLVGPLLPALRKKREMVALDEGA